MTRKSLPGVGHLLASGSTFPYPVPGGGGGITIIRGYYSRYIYKTHNIVTVIHDYGHDIHTTLGYAITVSSFRYLGVTITEDLRWSLHVSNISSKAKRGSRVSVQEV